MKKQHEHILLEPEQSQRLQDESDRSGASKSEIMRCALNQYFSEDDAWDRQMKRDVEAGRLDEIIARAKKQYKEGKYSEL